MIDVVLDELVKVAIEYGRHSKSLDWPTSDDDTGRKQREECKAMMIKYEHQIDILSLCIKEAIWSNER